MLSFGRFSDEICIRIRYSIQWCEVFSDLKASIKYLLKGDENLLLILLPKLLEQILRIARQLYRIGQ